MIIPASSLTLEQQTEAFNRGFEQYLVPLQFSPEFFAEKLMLEGVSLEHSLAVVEDGEPLGMALLAYEGTHGWVAGIGIAPALRGKGQGRVLTEKLIETAAGLGLHDVTLEVLTPNTPAIATYRKLGFETFRELVILKAQPFSPPAYSADSVSPLSSAWLDDFDSLHPIPPCWQRSPSVLRRMVQTPKATALGSYDPSGPTQAVVLFKPAPHEIRLCDIGARSGQEEKLISILAELSNQSPSLPLRIVNEPENSPFISILKTCGFQEILRQYEMKLQLPGSAGILPT